MVPLGLKVDIIIGKCMGIYGGCVEYTLNTSIDVLISGTVVNLYISFVFRFEFSLAVIFKKGLGKS